MPVARIIIRQPVTSDANEVRDLVAELRAGGYDVDVAQLHTAADDAADLLIDLNLVSTSHALEAAAHFAADGDTEIFVAPGVIPSDGEPAPGVPAESRARAKQTANDAPGSASAGSRFGQTLEDVGEAFTDARQGIGESVASMGERIAARWNQFRQRRAEAAELRRLGEERRYAEREESHRRQELQLQRLAEEKERARAKREREAAEQMRLMREQMAREAAERAERDRITHEESARQAAERAARENLLREQMAQEAAARAQRVREEEQEQQRLAVIEGEQVRQRQMQEAQRAAEGERQRREEQAEQPVPVPVPISMRQNRQNAVRPQMIPAAAYAARRIATPREKQWQRAAFLASIVALAAMLAFGIILSVRPSSPLPDTVLKNGAQQKVPFGPASAIANPQASRPAKFTSAPVAPKAVSPSKPSPAVPMPRARRPRNGNEIVAEDEVVVRHAPTSRNQRAQTTPNSAGVRHYSDQD